MSLSQNCCELKTDTVNTRNSRPASVFLFICVICFFGCVFFNFLNGTWDISRGFSQRSVKQIYNLLRFVKPKYNSHAVFFYIRILPPLVSGNYNSGMLANFFCDSDGVINTTACLQLLSWC